MYKTIKTSRVVISDEKYYIGVGQIQFEVSELDYSNYCKLMEYTFEYRDIQDINHFMIINHIPTEMFQNLLDKRIIVRDLEYPSSDTKEYKNALYMDLLVTNRSELQKNIKNTTFLVIGAGGIGNFIGFALNSLEPHKIVLIDGDKVDESNLNRQFMFTYNDINKFKTDVLKEKLEERSRNVIVESCSKFITNDFLEKIIYENKNHSIVGIVSADDNAIPILAPIFKKHKIPFLNIGYLNDISIIGPFYIPGISANSFFSKGIEDHQPEFNVINSYYDTPSSFGNNALSSGMAFNEILLFLSGNIKDMVSINTRVGLTNKGLKVMKSITN